MTLTAIVVNINSIEYEKTPSESYLSHFTIRSRCPSGYDYFNGALKYDLLIEDTNRFHFDGAFLMSGQDIILDLTLNLHELNSTMNGSGLKSYFSSVLYFSIIRNLLCNSSPQCHIIIRNY